MTIRIFYTTKNFFGKLIEREDVLETMNDIDCRKAVNKCLNYIKNHTLSAFRVELDDIFYLIESKDQDSEGIFTVTKCYGRNHDMPTKMTAKTIRSLTNAA